MKSYGLATILRWQAKGKAAMASQSRACAFDVRDDCCTRTIIVTRRSIKKTDRNDARIIAFPQQRHVAETHLKESIHAELASLIAIRNCMVKMRTSALNKVRGMLNRHGIKVGKQALDNGKDFAKKLGLHEWSQVELIQLKAIAAHVVILNE